MMRERAREQQQEEEQETTEQALHLRRDPLPFSLTDTAILSYLFRLYFHFVRHKHLQPPSRLQKASVCFPLPPAIINMRPLCKQRRTSDAPDAPTAMTDGIVRS